MGLSLLEACTWEGVWSRPGLSSLSFPVLLGRVPAPSGPSHLLKGCALGRHHSRIDLRTGRLPDRDWLWGCGVTEHSL